MADRYTYSYEYDQPYIWNADEPITADLVNRMEAGIVKALNQGADNEDAIDSVSTVATRADTTATTLSNTDIPKINSAIEGLGRQTSQGQDAWAQVKPASVDRNMTLDYRITQVETTASNAKNRVGEVETAITNAAGGVKDIYGNVSLAARLNQIQEEIDDNQSSAEGAIGNLSTEISNAAQKPAGTSGDWHLVDNIQSIKDRVTGVETEIKFAHRSDRTGDTLMARFNDIDNTETSGSIINRVTALDDNTDANSLISRVALIESELTSGSDTGIMYNTRLDQVIGEVAGTHRTTGDTLDARLDDIDSTEVGANTIANRLAATENEIEGAHMVTGEDEETGEPIRTGTLNDRFENAEGAISTLNEAIYSIYDDSDPEHIVPAGLNQRITALETTVDTPTTGLSAVVGNLTTVVSAPTTGLIDRVSALESEVDMTSENSRIDTIISTIGDDNNGLIGRIKTLEDEPKSATEIIPSTYIEYDEHDKPTIYTSENSNEHDNAHLATVSSDKDYLLQKGDKYYYWKYIDNKWELISGGNKGGGTGTSSAVIAASLPAIAKADANIDYYIGNAENGYKHYRYVPSANEEEDGAFITILPKQLDDNLNNLLNYAVVTSVTKTNNYTDNDAWPAADTISGGPAVYAINDTAHASNLFNDFVAVRNVRINAEYEEGSDTPKSQTLQILDTQGHLIEYPIVGGSGGSAYSIRFLSTLSNNTFTVPQDANYHTIVSAKAIVKQGSALLDGVSFSGEILYRLQTEAADTWHKSNIILPSIQNNKEFSVDVSSILALNATTIVQIALTINTGDGEPVVRTVDYTITKTQISISSTFNPATVLSSANLVVHFTCMGAGLKKYVHALVDDIETANSPKETMAHNEEDEITIPLQGLSNGSHTLQLYFTTEGNVSSNKLNYYIIYNLDSARTQPIIGVNAVSDSIVDGEELAVNYTAYTPGKETTERVEIKLYTINDENEHIIYNDQINTRTNIPIELSTWKTTNYPTPITPAEGQPEKPVHVYVEITAYNTIETTNEQDEPITIVETDTKTTEIVINRFTNPNNYDFSEVAPNNLLYSYTAYGKSNNDANRANYEYVYTANDETATELTFNGTFTGFNWATNGYVDGDSLLINGGAKYSINVPIFASKYNGTTIEASSAQDITQYGRTIEIDYEVRSATDLNATIIECREPDVEGQPPKPGIRITPSYCYLTNKTTPAEIDEQDGFIINESSIAAAYLQTNTRIHLVFVIEPWSNEKAFDKKFHQSVNIYINGEFANSCPYERDSEGRIIDDFTSNATFTLGSDTCILKVYNIKMYNRGLTRQQVLQLYKLSPNLLYDRLSRFENNDILTDGTVDYEKAKRRFTCLLLKGPDPAAQDTLDWPTISPFKGSPSPAKRKKKATDTDYEGKTESGLILTKPSSDPTTDGFVEEFNLCDKVPADAPAYLGATGAYCSSNNVQGTSSQKYPLHNLKVYLAKWQKEKTTTTNVALEPGEEVEEGVETVEIDGVMYKVVTETTPAQIKKVKYSLKGYNADGTPIGTEESTLCWKADYMSTDHANTYNANIADTLFINPADEGWDPKWDQKHLQNTVYGIRCLLFQQQGDNATPVFVGDGCLNNDKGNTKTYGLDADGDDGNDTLRQKWEFTNNTSPLDVFKSDNLFAINQKDSERKMFAKGAFECNFPDEGDLKDAGLEPNYNHLQLLLTWINKRACYLDYTVFDDNTNQEINYTVSDVYGSGGTYNGIEYDTERELKKAIFKNEFETHFIKSHVLRYYLFSEYVALCDNRAKNMFLRSEDVRKEVIKNTSNVDILTGNTYPDDGTLWSSFVQTNGNNAGITHPEVINWTGSTFARWAPVLYDLDSCFGVENVGLITIKYNADWQYKYNNKEAFSGFDSLFWLMVEDTYGDELKALAKQLYNSELNFTNFYRQQITGNLNATCPVVTNEDMILKYQKPWNEGFINYAEDPDPVTGKYPEQTPEYKYIQRGTRTMQKATFMRQRSMLLSSKYVSTEFTNSMISFRAGKLITGNDTLLTLVANQDLYPAIIFSDNNTLVRPTARVINGVAEEITDGNYYVTAGTPCQITTSQIGNSDTVKIVGALVLNDIGDISKYYPYELKVGSGTNLKRLIVGSDAIGYVNDSTQTIEGLSDCALLEEINVRNLTKMSSLNLGGNGLIKKVYAKGSNITTISLPNGGVLQEIEYGARTTNITLLNQSFFTTFVHEDNNYAQLTKLWVENTPNVPITDILVKRLGGLENGIRLVGINIDLGSDSTLLDMLATDELVLGKRLTANGSLDSNRTLPPYISGTIRITKVRRSVYDKLHSLYPDLTVTVTSEIISEHAITYKNVDAQNNETTLLTLYRTSEEQIPDPVLEQDPITGKYYIQSAPEGQVGFDGTQYVPLRAEDAQYIYRFGTYNNRGEYQKYSGWVVKENGNTRPTSNTSIAGPLTLIAVYPEASNIKQKYNITWYDDTNAPIYSQEDVEYGTDGSQITPPSKYNQQHPLTVKKLVNGIYKVFKGWDRPVNIVKGNIDVHSLWYEFDGNFSTFTDIDELNPAALYALTRLDANTRNNILQSHLGRDIKYIQLGHDYEYNSDYITTYNLMPDSGDNIILDGVNDSAVQIYNEIYPLMDRKQDFTLALDFKFLLDDTIWNASTSEYVLASCFRNVGGSRNGFKVSLVKNSETLPEIQVKWGNTSQVIDRISISTVSGNTVYNSYRNMLVLRHIGTEPDTLYVYYTNPSNDPQHYSNSGVVMSTLNWGSSVAVDAPLILGGNYTLDGNGRNIIEDSANHVKAKGTIYYAKYWAEDLGSNNCLELAAWPHETIGYKISGYYDGLPSSSSDSKLIIGDSSTNTINFTPAQVLGDRTYNYNLNNTNAFNGTNTTLVNGWTNALVRDYMNSTVYDAFPTAYQSLIEKVKINTVSQVSENTSNTSPTSGRADEVYDFIYLPSLYEFDPTVPTASPYRNEAIHSLAWMDAGSINNVYTLVNNRLTLEEVSSINYLRFLFANKAITTNARIFHMDSNTNPALRTFYLDNVAITAQPGDIWYDNNTAYMYVSADDIDSGIIVDSTRSGGSSGGGWMPASIWALRTYNYSAVRRYAYAFMKILRDGSISTVEDYGANTINRALVPQFSI